MTEDSQPYTTPGMKRARVEIIPLIDVIFFLLATFVLFTLSLSRIQSLPLTLPRGGDGAVHEEDHVVVDRREELLDTIEALAGERDQDEKIWGSMVKQALKRRDPGFNESYFGFRTFSDLLEEAQTRKLLLLEPDQKSGGYVIKRVTG